MKSKKELQREYILQYLEKRDIYLIGLYDFIYEFSDRFDIKLESAKSISRKILEELCNECLVIKTTNCVNTSTYSCSERWQYVNIYYKKRRIYKNDI